MISKGKISISKYVKTKDDASLRLDGAVMIRFMNMGQSRIWIDETVVIEPGEAFIEGDLSGPGIDHSYNVNFLALGSPPAADVPKVYAGNRLHIRVFKRIAHARK